MKSTRMLTAALIVGAIAALLMNGDTRAQSPEAQLPLMTVKASNGAVLGPLTAVDGNSRANVLFSDPTMGGRPLVMTVEKQGMRPFEFQMWFSGLDCSGTAYMRPPETRFGLNKMTGIMYTVGPGTGGNIYLFRSDSSGPGASVNYNSTYSIANPDFDTVTCSNGAGSSTLVTASEVVNITTDFPHPYSVTF